MKRVRARKPIDMFLNDVDEEFRQWYERARRDVRVQGWLNLLIALACLTIIMRLATS